MLREVLFICVCSFVNKIVVRLNWLRWLIVAPFFLRQAFISVPLSILGSPARKLLEIEMNLINGMLATQNDSMRTAEVDGRCVGSTVWLSALCWMISCTCKKVAEINSIVAAAIIACHFRTSYNAHAAAHMYYIITLNAAIAYQQQHGPLD